MAEPREQTYPLSDTDKIAIPFNIARPQGLMIVSITDAASVTKTLINPDSPHVFLCDIDCLVTFAGTPDRTSAANQPDTFYVPAGREIAISPLDAEFKAQALIATQTGKLIVQAFEPYQSLGRDLIQDRIP